MADYIPIEFSQLTSGGNVQVGDIIVGLRGGLNRKFTFNAITSITGTANEIVVTGTTTPTIAIANNAILPGSAGVTVPNGTTAQRAGTAGTLRLNTTTTELEVTLDGASWITLTGAGGTVLSVSGTANRITSTGGVNPVIDIAATYVGQTSITTLGTIATGTWNANTIATTVGGTGLTSYALGDTLYGSAPNVLSKLSGNTTAVKQYLSQTGTGVVSAAPSWSTIDGGDITGAALTKVDDTNVTLTLGGSPSTALLRASSITAGWTGTLSGARGGTGVNNGASTITVGGNFTMSGAFTFTGTLTGNTAVTFPTSGTLATTGGASIPTVAQGDLLYGSAANVLSTLAKDTNATRYLSNTGGSNNPAWAQVDLTNGVIGVLSVANGGSGTSTAFTQGSVIFAGAAGIYSQDNANFFWDDTNNRLGIGTASPGFDLHINRSASGSAVAARVQNTEATNPASDAHMWLRTATGGGNPHFVVQVDAAQAYAFGIDQADSSKFKLSRSTTVATNTVLTITSAGAATFAGSLAADSLTLTNPLVVTSGGTGLATVAQGDLLYGSAANTLSALAKNTSATRYLSNTGVSNNPAWAQIDLSNGVTGVLPLANGGTNANLTASTGGIVYSGASALAILSGTATARQMLQSGASAAPAWSTTTWPATTTANQILYSSAASVIGEITTANSAVLVTNSSGVPAFSGTMTNGQLIIGSTGGTPAAATLTAGTGITITNAANSITIAASSGSGAWTKISSSTASSSATIDFTSLTNAYMMYMVVIDRALPATDAVAFQMRASTNNGSSYYSTNEYSYANMIAWASDGSYISRGGTGAAACLMTGNDANYYVGNATNEGITGTFFIYNPSGTSYGRTTGNFSYTEPSGSLRESSHAGRIDVAADIDAIRFMFSSGNIASGTFTLYGLTA